MTSRPAWDQDTAVEYINTWQRLALSHSDDPYVVRTYGAPSSEWTLPVNLYIQTLFAFDLLNGTVGAYVICFASWKAETNSKLLDKLTATYQMQLDASSSSETFRMRDSAMVITYYCRRLSVWTSYRPLAKCEREPRYVPLPVAIAHQSLHIGKLTVLHIAGNAFMAASFTNDTARVQLIDILWKYASNNDTDGPLGNIFGVEAGQRIGETMRLAFQSSLCSGSMLLLNVSLAQHWEPSLHHWFEGESRITRR